MGKSHFGTDRARKGVGKPIWGKFGQVRHLRPICLDGRDGFSPKSEWKGQAIWIDNAQYADEFTLFTLINLAITSDISCSSSL